MVGEPLQLDLLIEPCGIDRWLGHARQRRRQRRLIFRLREFDERPREPCLLEHPVTATPRRVVLAALAGALEESVPLTGRDDRPLHDERTPGCHETSSGNVSSRFLTKARNSSATAPSMSRWSNEIEK